MNVAYQEVNPFNPKNPNVRKVWIRDYRTPLEKVPPLQGFGVQVDRELSRNIPMGDGREYDLAVWLPDTLFTLYLTSFEFFSIESPAPAGKEK